MHLLQNNPAFNFHSSNYLQKQIAIFSSIHKYLDLQELTPSILNDMVKRVYVHAPQIIDGKRTQQIDIFYDFVGILPMSLLKQNSETA